MDQTTRATRFLAADEGAIQEAAKILREGGLVSFPTETVYGLGADATSGEAVAKIYEAKQRPAFNPLIAHVPAMQEGLALGQFNAHARKLAEAFWPGALTLVVPVSSDCPVSLLARAGHDTIAVRVPDHPVALALLRRAGLPVAAPSANVSGTVSPTTAQHVADGLSGRIDVILDGGACSVGVESTIIACLGPQPVLLRPGGIPVADIEQILGLTVRRSHEGQDAPALASAQTKQAPGLLAPGMLASHYAPRANVRLQAVEAYPNEAILDFAASLAAYATTSPAYFDLSPNGDLRQAAANLFSFLRQADAAGVSTIAIAPVPSAGLGEAINDRLARAAADP